MCPKHPAFQLASGNLSEMSDVLSLSAHCQALALVAQVAVAEPGLVTACVLLTRSQLSLLPEAGQAGDRAS